MSRPNAFSQDPNGFDRGSTFRAAYGANTLRDRADRQARLARMEAIDLSKRQFVVSKYFAPQRYGYNLVLLVPDAGATSVTVDFRGVVQDSVAAGYDSGKHDLEPGYGEYPATDIQKQPGSNWRWGLVAIDTQSRSTKSDMFSGASGSVTMNLPANLKELFFVVVAAPDVLHKIFW